MQLIVITETDLSDNQDSVIGVADSLENADKLINEYYGDPILISRDDIRESSLEFKAKYKIKDVNGNNWYVEILTEWFTLNCA